MLAINVPEIKGQARISRTTAVKSRVVDLRFVSFALCQQCTWFIIFYFKKLEEAARVRHNVIMLQLKRSTAIRAPKVQHGNISNGDEYLLLLNEQGKRMRAKMI
jgi:hypothetical protein